MSLRIDVDEVARVLLADGWHDVADASFSLDSYEYLWSGRQGVKLADLAGRDDPMLLHGGGNSGVCATGFAFTDRDTGDTLYGPLTAILAVATPGRGQQA